MTTNPSTYLDESIELIKRLAAVAESNGETTQFPVPWDCYLAYAFAINFSATKGDRVFHHSLSLPIEGKKVRVFPVIG